MNTNPTRANTPTLQRTDVPYLELNQASRQVECEKCSRITRAYFAKITHDSAVRYFCSYTCFQLTMVDTQCYVCEKVTRSAKTINTPAGPIDLCCKQCIEAYKTEMFN